MIGREMMADRFLNLRPGCGGLGRKPPPMQIGGPLLLHGTGQFALTVSGTAHHIAIIEKISKSRPPNQAFPVLLASLIIGERKSFKNDEVRVEILGETVGYIPAHFVTQYTEWLKRWNYIDKAIRCHATVECFFSEAGTSARYAVRLDIAVPFRMTAIVE